MKPADSVSQEGLCCTECCTPSVQESVRRLGALADDEMVHLCHECDALMDARLRDELGVAGAEGERTNPLLLAVRSEERLAEPLRPAVMMATARE